MTAIPKPPKSKKTSVAAPQLTEYDYTEIGERINESLEFGAEVEIQIYHQKRYETFRGVVTSADAQSGYLKLRVGYDTLKININAIVGVN
ncbi:YolD-like family protein [Sporosarcina sp. FSL W7-1349]|uniref:YolD-like family protein n=1 Tax=Sporosarcina sp. FSL W7-1349 TaxID=2921561 RepID=UPI0030F70B91